MQLSLTAWLAMKWKDLSDKPQKEKQMGFLKKLFGNIEKANKGEISAEELFHLSPLI